MPSLPILSGAKEYPDGIIEELKSKVPTLALDAAQVARDNGNPRGMNVVLLGALVQLLGIANIDWTAAVKANVKPQFVDGNLRCLEAGMKLAESLA